MEVETELPLSSKQMRRHLESLEIQPSLPSNATETLSIVKAFHDELDKLINGENPNGEFKSFFRNPSSLTFETVDGSPIEISDQDLTIVTIAPSNFASDYPDNPAQDQAGPGSPEDQYVSFKVGQVISQPASSSPGITYLTVVTLY